MQFNLLHGFTQTSESWTVPAAALRELLPDASIWTPDMPGHGTGTGLPLGLEEGATALADLAQPGIWIGYSMGGRYLLHIAVQQPEVVQGLVLVSTTAGLEDDVERAERRAADDALADNIEREGVPEFLSRWMSLPMFSRLQATPEDLAARNRNSSVGLAESLRQAGTGRQRPLWERLGAISVPTLIITGSEDVKFCELGNRLAAHIPKSEHQIIPSAGHAVHLEQPSQFAQLITQWLEQGYGSQSTTE